MNTLNSKFLSNCRHVLLQHPEQTFQVHLMNPACMGHFGKSRGEIGDMSIEPFDVDVAAWIHSNKASEMCSIVPRDVRHEPFFDDFLALATASLLTSELVKW